MVLKMSRAQDKLAGLQTLLSEMTNDELLEFVRSVRTERKIPQHQVKAKAKKKVKAKDDLMALARALGPEKLKKLLEGK